MKRFSIWCAAALLCVLLCACHNDRIWLPTSLDIPTVPVTTEATEPPEVRASVMVGREQTFSYTDKNKNTVSCLYRVPKLTAQTEDAEAINAKIAHDFDGLFSAAQKAVNNNKDPEPDSINYTASVSDDIVTLLITVEWQGHRLTYAAYNYNKTTGKQLDNAALLNYLQRDYDETFSGLKESLQQDYTAKFREENFADDYYYQLDKTISDEAVQRSQLYLNPDAELYAVCTEYASTGNGAFQVLIRC